MIRRCDERDFDLIWSIVNDGAQAYKNVIPADCWTEPYMSRDELREEMDHGVSFWGYEENGTLTGVMGIQQVHDVTLIRHAYVLTGSQKQGIGGRLLSHLMSLAERPVLIGTWADAVWAIRFYEKHGFRLVTPDQKARLLERYWNVSPRQAEVSVVLADPNWQEQVPVRPHFECANPILRVTEMSRAVRYYEDVLGFSNADWGSDDFTCVTRDGASIYLSEGDQGQPGTWVWIGVADVEALYKEYQPKGAIILHEPENFPWAYEMKIGDPDGHVLRFGSDPRDDG